MWAGRWVEQQFRCNVSKYRESDLYGADWIVRQKPKEKDKENVEFGEVGW